jgi:hypothetical protein
MIHACHSSQLLEEVGEADKSVQQCLNAMQGVHGDWLNEVVDTQPPWREQHGQLCAGDLHLRLSVENHRWVL